jgi:hypothetical protein
MPCRPVPRADSTSTISRYAGKMAQASDLTGLADGIAEVWWARRQDAPPRLTGLLDETEQERWTTYSARG